MDLPSVSTLRAKLAKRIVQTQLELSCAKLLERYLGSPEHFRGPFITPITDPYDSLDPKKAAAPGFIDVNFDELDEHTRRRDPLADPTIEWKVGVIGGGIGGLYASLILEDLGITNEVSEATGRTGGRMWSYRFSSKPGDYYEVGAMLFPDIPIMRRTFRLLALLNITRDNNPHPAEGCLIPYYFEGPNNPWLYNNILKTNVTAGEILKRVFQEWRDGLASDFENTMAKLIAIDRRAISLRSYMMEKFGRETEGLDIDGPELYYMTNWCEVMDARTRHFDAAFISWVVLSLEFEYPPGPAPTYDPKPIRDPIGDEPPVHKHDYSWWILNGGTDIVAQRTAAKLANKPFNHLRVTGISHAQGEEQGMPMKVTMLQSHPHNPDRPPTPITKEYTHVITTTTMPCLDIMDLRNVGLTYGQREAIRVLSYDNAVKVGIKFRTRWWAEEKGITQSGVGMTDRPTRVVVYPSHALDTPAGESGVLIACYSAAQDASRLGGNESWIFDTVMADLAAMHEYDEGALRKLVVSYHVHDWNHDPYVNGHFCMPGPGQFSSLFGYIRRPASQGRLFVAGEGTSVFPGWIVGALNSSYRAIHQMLWCELYRRLGRWEDMGYIWCLIMRLRQNWGNGMEPEEEYDSDPMKAAGWETFLAMSGIDV
ncbi:hypothetical protein BBK36DRAFT_62205 [Trichoderma citrinoviride]|uniref:Amine oxidase domain-containing protein n=1 Tax=Trichoderma citrinoviride TaxID=58853 RepID=A0A2T4AXQ3_9HYPO|nr:hypothetical protein BBK36DRAFT_62205 [Trichoderma citrinoviride]PTB61860.1 hypothetical protein BBK36DRAFT_62205 [Trichoderma citrinoviride]